MIDKMSKNATIDPNPKIIRLYMNDWKEVLNFTKMIRPVCSKIKYPNYLVWLNGFDPVIITIKWDSVVHRYDIYRNLHIENREWSYQENDLKERIKALKEKNDALCRELERSTILNNLIKEVKND